MSGIDRLTPASLRGLTRPRWGAGKRDPDLYRRRQRMLALGLLAGVAY